MRDLAAKLKKSIKKLIEFQVRLILAVFYFILIMPLGLFIIIFKDYLEIRSAPSWKKRRPIGDPRYFLKGQ